MIQRITPVRFFSLLTAVLVLSAAECPVDDPTNPPPPSGDPTPTALVRVSGDGQSATVGQGLANPLIVRVDDQFGNAMSGVSVSFSATQGGGAVDPTSGSTGSNGETSTTWTLGTTAGAQQVTASVGSSATTVFSATGLAGAPATVAVNDGDTQQVLAGTAVPVPPSVLVEDTHGNPVADADVTFAVASGGGTVTGEATTSSASGVATVGSWTLGSGSNSLTATVTGSGIAGNPVTFTAEGLVSLFDIEIRYVTGTNPNTAQQQAFDNAAAKWATIITGDLSDHVVDLPSAGTCGGASRPIIDETIDDLVIYAEFVDIDGPFGVQGQAGPCVIRGGTGLPSLGGMLFDIADLARLETNGDLEIVILHEMGHVLGFGTLWNNAGLLQLPSDPDGTPPGTPGNDTYFSGARAITAFNSNGGAGYVGNVVPVENDNANYGTGSLDGHWRESVFQTELMSPSLNSGVTNPISVVTAASLGDMGFQVNEQAADTYVVPAPMPALVTSDSRSIVLYGDIWMGPIAVVDETGWVVRVIRQQQ